MKIKKKHIIIIVVLILVALSQVALVSLVYAHKLPESLAVLVARAYRLKAGSISKGGEKLDVYISDYFFNQDIISQFINAQQAKASARGDQDYIPPKAEEINDTIWEKMIKEAWLGYISRQADIRVNPEDLEVYLQSVGDQEALRQEAEKDFNFSFADYQQAVIEPFILEAKVYKYLLSNFSDQEGGQKAQQAYQALESGKDFTEVAKEYSDDPIYSDKSLWLSEDSLSDFYEPIRNLKPGEFSEIVISPVAYVIWYVRDVVSEESQAPVWEVRGIFIEAKSIESFLDDYLSGAEIKKIY